MKALVLAVALVGLIGAGASAGAAAGASLRLVGCVATGPKLVHRGPSDQRVVALTFDDGPWVHTRAIVNILEQKGVVATFFQNGKRVAKFAALDRRMLRDGDMIGNHSWDHPDLKKFSREISKSQIRRTTAAIRKATGFRPCLFRFPYGHFRRDEVADARELGFTTIQWDVDTFDWSRPGVRAIYNKVVSRTRPGSIILQHDGTEPGISDDHRRQTVAALPREIDYLRSQGYRFVTVTQLLGYRLIYKQ